MEMSWIMWTSAFLSMTEAQLAVYPAGSQVMRRGDKAQHSAHKRHRALGKCVGAFRAVRIIYISKEVVKRLVATSLFKRRAGKQFIQATFGHLNKSLMTPSASLDEAAEVFL